MMTSSSSLVLDRTHAPAAQPVRSIALPEPEVTALTGGARLHVLRATAQPAVQVQIVLPAGTWQEPAPGTALLTARTLTEGTQRRTAAQIAEYVAAYGAFLESQSSPDHASLTLYCLTRHFDSLLSLIGELLTEAAFPDREVESMRARLAQGIQVEREKNSYLATERFSRNLFGLHHPYCAEVDVPRLLATSAGELRAFYQQRYSLHGAEIFVAGDVSDAQLTNLLAALPLVSDVRPAPLAEAHELATGTERQDEIRIEKSLQSAVRMGRLWPTPHHPDTHRLSLLNKILGGYFGSRLMKNIREDKGFTYGIYAGIHHRDHASWMVIGADVNAESTEATFTEIRRELQTLRAEPVPATELETVRNYTTGKFLGEVSNVFDQLGKYRFRVLSGLPPTYYNDFLAAVATTTADDLLALAQVWLDPDLMQEVAVGRRG